MSYTPPPRRPRWEPKPLFGGLQSGAMVLYAILAFGLTGLALYMAFIENRPLTSGYVAAPTIGAFWFGLRLFMMLGSRK